MLADADTALPELFAEYYKLPKGGKPLQGVKNARYAPYINPKVKKQIGVETPIAAKAIAATEK